MSESDGEKLRSGAPHQADDDGQKNSYSLPSVTSKSYRPLFSLESGILMH